MIHEHQKSESLARELIMITDKEVKGCNPIWLEIEFEDDHPRLKTTQTHQWRERERDHENPDNLLKVMSQFPIWALQLFLFSARSF